MKLCPLIFEPIFKPKIWGGRTLEQLVAKKLPPNEPIGESWEVADLEDDQSLVACGPAKGKTLGELVKEWGEGLLGGASLFEGRFPLLIKYLDACEHLSVQVHPDQTMADRYGGNVRVKNEAWYIVGAKPDGCIYRGFVDGVDKAAYERAIADGTVKSILKRIPVKAGECYYLPSGTVHALGAGVVVAEIQTPSDITYRVFDWNRVDAKTGQPRELHIEKALECSNLSSQQIVGELYEVEQTTQGNVTHLVNCESFITDRIKMAEGKIWGIPKNELFIFMILEGRGILTYDGSDDPQEFGCGDTVVVPAGLENAQFHTKADTIWLETTLPKS